MDAIKAQEENIKFYEANYDILEQWHLSPGKKVVLGDKSKRVCRFCQKKSPEVTFSKVAHAIPEALGNKSIESTYECDTCNEDFGTGIENDLGNWSKPTRTLIRIRGKKGVPTLKKGGDKPGWRIEYDQNTLNVTAYEDDHIYSVDEQNRQFTLDLRRDAYTPVAVLKAFQKIGLTLLPDEEIDNFRRLIAWVRTTDHSVPYLRDCPVIYTFQPGPMPNDLISALILRRKHGVTGYPYAFLVLGYGNEVYQVPLPSDQHDVQIEGQPLNIYPFPVPGHVDQATYGVPKVGVLNWMDSNVKKGDTVLIQMGFESSTHTKHPGAS